MTEALKQAQATAEGINNLMHLFKWWLDWDKTSTEPETNLVSIPERPSRKVTQAWVDLLIDAESLIRTALTQATASEQGEPYTTIDMGYGKWEVGAGTSAGVPCVAFGVHGSGNVGELITIEPRQMSVEETHAVITFANYEGFAVLQEKMDEVRALHFSTDQPAPAARPMPEAQALEIAGRVSTCVEAIREAEAFHHIGSQPTAPAAPAERVEGYAGVIAWLGDKQVKAVLTEKQLDHERQPGFELSRTAAWCCANLTGAAPAAVTAVPEDVVKNADRYVWLRDASVPPHNFYLSVPEEFDGVKYQPSEVDAYIDAAMLASAPTSTKGGES